MAIEQDVAVPKLDSFSQPTAPAPDRRTRLVDAMIGWRLDPFVARSLGVAVALVAAAQLLLPSTAVTDEPKRPPVQQGQELQPQ
jgi:hypothetical protein